jgi:hypothetical protein
MVLLFVTRVPTIVSTWQNGNTGQLAFTSFFLSFAGSAARTLTVLNESDDFMYRLMYISALTLNTIIMVQFALYWNVPKRARVTGPGAAKQKGGKID